MKNLTPTMKNWLLEQAKYYNVKLSNAPIQEQYFDLRMKTNELYEIDGEQSDNCSEMADCIHQTMIHLGIVKDPNDEEEMVSIKEARFTESEDLFNQPSMDYNLRLMFEGSTLSDYSIMYAC